MTYTVRHPRIEGYELEVNDLSAAKAAGWVPTEPAAEREPTAEPEPAPKPPRPRRTRKK